MPANADAVIPFQGGTPYFDAVITLEGMWIASPAALALLHLVALALLLVVTAAWGRHPGRRLLTASGAVTVTCLVLAWVGTFRPHDVPTEWVTILHQSPGEQNVSNLYARGVHAGANFHFVTSAVAEDGVWGLRAVVWLNVLLALVNAALFLHVAAGVAGPLWALPWTLVFALNPALFQAAFSELPTHLLTLYFLTGVVAWAVVTDPLPHARGVRGAALALCAVLTFLTLLTRLEVAVIGVVALASHLAFAALGEARWSAATVRAGALGRRILAMLGARPALVVVLCLVGWWLAFAGVPPDLVGRSQATGVYPFNPYVFALPFFLPMIGLPIGVGIAVALGLVPAVRRFRRFGGLALSLFMLNGAEFAAYTEYYSMVRFLGYMLPAAFFVGLFGRRQLDVLIAGWQPSWRHAARIAYVMTWCTVPLPGSLEYFARPAYDLHGAWSQVLLDRNPQREVRHLLALTERNPECVFVTRVVRIDADPTVIEHYQYGVFGKPVPEPVFVDEDAMTLDEVVARHARGASCVRLYYGSDCNLTTSDRCETFVAGRRRIDEARFWSQPYQGPLGWGYAAPEMVLATYAWP